MAAPTTGDDYRSCRESEWATCLTHGGRMLAPLFCQTKSVLLDVQAERARQYARYGTNDSLAFGTGPDVKWLTPFHRASAGLIEAEFRADYEEYKAETGGPPTWMHLIREEMAEAFAEADLARLRAEAIQVAALCVSMIEKIDAREETAR